MRASRRLQRHTDRRFDEPPVPPLYFRANPFIMPKWLKGVIPTGHQFTSALWLEHWRVAP